MTADILQDKNGLEGSQNSEKVWLSAQGKRRVESLNIELEQL
jgi:hypothetical protein